MGHIWFWIIIGIVVGALAKRLSPGERSGGLIGDLCLGVVGAFLGGWLFLLVLGSSYPGWIGSTVAAIVGSCLLLYTLRAVTSQSMV